MCFVLVILSKLPFSRQIMTSAVTWLGPSAKIGIFEILRLGLLLIRTLFYNSCYERLLKSKVGNNILRVLIEQIGDPATADFVYSQIDSIFNKIRFQNPHSLLPFMNLILEKAKHRYVSNFIVHVCVQSNHFVCFSTAW